MLVRQLHESEPKSEMGWRRWERSRPLHQPFVRW